MTRTMFAVMLLATASMPAIAGEQILDQDGSKAMQDIDQTTTASTSTEGRNVSPTVDQSQMYSGCDHRRKSALNMM